MDTLYIPSVAAKFEVKLWTDEDRLKHCSLKLGWYFLLSPVKVTSSTALRLAQLPSAAMVNRGGYVACSKSLYHSVP